MATWHQMRSKTRLYHDTKWTALVDPPNDMRYAVLFDTEAEARAYCEKRKHAYVLRPITPNRRMTT